jgi:threonine dehydratase
MCPAHPHVSGVAQPTHFIRQPRLSEALGADVTLACETFQWTGSFKFRAAYHVAASVPQAHILTASSGNFGQALAYACRLVGKTCTIVMPNTSAQVKVEAVTAYGGTVDLIDTEHCSRADRVAELSRAMPHAYVASAYDDPLVIEGNATLGAEIARSGRPFDAVLAPVGGGGLCSGILTGMRTAGVQTPLYGAEPLLANDAARSLRSGWIVRNEREPQTIADGARTVSLGVHNWAVLQHGIAAIMEVPEEAIRQAVRVLYQLANVKAEPTGALAVGALLVAPERFRGTSVCCVVSGGNVDAHTYASLIA